MLQTVGNTGFLSNSLSIKVFKIFYAFDIAIKRNIKNALVKIFLHWCRKRRVLFERKVIVRMGTRENQKKYDDKNNDNMASSIYSKVPIDQGGKHVV